ncbi:hypothetical protein E2P81_ATG12016 [Venturia nashicola]|uniref:Uncharacterized protein n=1 Tax=Venturia nashicola TaxID=86259 RepID=A0A4Z1P7S9_9PEZI|nr:hypothetical protein E6O75_ATG11715 [Venturia nashicola]TLD24680.1 hypothetical protein E2P81_ATG12016 [Venturia nashicola]
MLRNPASTTSEQSRPPPPGHALTASAVPRAHSDESWIEVSSQPSSSSLSSVGEEIVTTGLRVQHDSNARRRRRLRRHATDNTPGSGDNDSMEEYEESEADSDRVLSSSNEALQPSPFQHEWRPLGTNFTLSSASSDNAYTSIGEDADENATAIGVISNEPCFTPQPNAFTHRTTSTPAARGPQESNTSYFTHRPARNSTQRHSYSTARQQHAPYNMISPSYQADHDAALRASLSTLLSCAAAARGLTKKDNTIQARQRPGPSNRVDAATIGLVPESAVFGGSQVPSPATSTNADKSKRKAATTTAAAQRSSSKERRVTKKAKRTSTWTPATMDEVSPTLFTWVVSAGVVVLVSAISFTAGYASGKEAGHAEALGSLGEAGGFCGRDARDTVLDGAGRGLRRLRLGGAASSIRV